MGTRIDILYRFPLTDNVGTCHADNQYPQSSVFGLCLRKDQRPTNELQLDLATCPTVHQFQFTDTYLVHRPIAHKRSFLFDLGTQRSLDSLSFATS